MSGWRWIVVRVTGGLKASRSARTAARRTCGGRALALPAIVAIALAATLAATASGWQQATPGRVLRLPGDHVSHPGYRLEWWYYTGNVDAAGGRRFGYQLTFFRVGIDPAPRNPSRWAVRDLFVAHLAVTDVTGRRYRFAERVNRAGPGWADAATDAYHVWNEDWSAALEGRRHHLRASDGDIGLDLVLDEGKPAVREGEDGYSRKGAGPGNASYYYSLTRMPTRGTLTVGSRAVAVTGTSWMDHEFGTTFLEPGQQGWDWISMQLDDGRELMVYRFRRSDGSTDPYSSGTLVEPDGRAVPLVRDAASARPPALVGFTLVPGRRWRSPASGAEYPVDWRVEVPAASADLRVTAALDDQELRTAESTGITYWEGAVDIRGTLRGHPVTGRGYLEMTGYAGTAMGRVLQSTN